MTVLNIKRYNAEPSCPCFLVSLNDIQLLCDCADIFSDEGDDDDSIPEPEPSYKFEDINWSMVDAILISNSHSLVMLPYITEMKNFRGKVLTPAPVLRFGKVLIDDLLSNAQNLSSAAINKAHRKSPTSKRYLLRYTKDEATNALSKVQTLAYHEYVDLFGLMKVKCVSAGYEIGSANWVLKTDNEKLGYISRSSLHRSFPMPMDFSEFSEIDVLIIGAVNMSQCLPFEAALEHFKIVTAQTLARGGHVMLPILPSGLIFHILEAVAAAKEEFDGNLLAEFDKPTAAAVSKATGSGGGGGGGEKAAPRGGVSLMGKVAKCPSLFISSEAKASLAYANASGEWLAADRESALYTAESPFRFDAWVRSGHLATLASLHSSPSQQTGGGSGGEKGSAPWAEGGLWPAYPSVFLAGHPSCRVGPALHLIRALLLGAGRQQPPQQQQQQHRLSNLNSLILVQSDEFSRRKLSPIGRLRKLLEPLRGTGEAAADLGEDESILGLPVCRMGVGLTAYWLPLRLDISAAQLPTLLGNCGVPKQALVIPHEVCQGGRLSIPSDARAIGRLQSLNIELETPSMVNVLVDPELLSSMAAMAVTATPAADASNTAAAAAAAAEVASTSADKEPRGGSSTHVALVEGRLCFRDGKYRLEPMEPNIRQILNEKSSLMHPVPSPPQSPKRPSSPSVSTSAPSPSTTATAEAGAAALGAYRLLLTKASGAGEVAVDAERLVKHLTESGVTGAKVISDPALLESFLSTHRRLHHRLPPHLLPPVGATAKSTALIVFPNTTTTILLTGGTSHITCQDEGTRVAIRNSLLACTPHMVALPGATTTTTATPAATTTATAATVTAVAAATTTTATTTTTASSSAAH